MNPYPRGLNLLQKISMSLMAVLVLLTFVAANLHALLWQSSDWLVSTVLPAVVVDLTNDERAQNNAAPLTRSTVLDEAARLKAEDMAKHEYFAHYSPDGVSPWHWFDEAGYVYAHAGENLAIHFTDSSEVVEAWMNSPTHRKNIVDGKFTEIGVGTAKGKFEGYDTVYVVQLFGAPGVTSLPKTSSQTPKPAPTPTPAPVVTTPIPTTAPAETVVATTEEQVVAPVQTASTSPVVLPAEVAEVTSALEEVAIPEIVETAPVIALEVEETQAEPVTVPVQAPEEIVVLESPLISTSSGLAVAQITTPRADHAGGTLASVATRPNQLLQIVYVTLGVVVLFLLSTSIVLEARRFHYRQVLYGVLLIIAMGGLWFTHALLTTGAVIA